LPGVVDLTLELGAFLVCLGSAMAGRMGFCPKDTCVIREPQRVLLHSVFSHAAGKQDGIRVEVGKQQSSSGKGGIVCDACGGNSSFLTNDTVVAQLGLTALCGCACVSCDNCWRLAIQRHSGTPFLAVFCVVCAPLIWFGFCVSSPTAILELCQVSR
jgi:hypothetical protein